MLFVPRSKGRRRVVHDTGVRSPPGLPWHSGDPRTRRGACRAPV